LSQPQINALVKKYIELRDEVKAIEAEFDLKKKPKKEAMEQIQGILLGFLDKSGGTAMKTEFGTCYSTTRYSASLADADAFMRFVVDQKAFHMLDRKANATAVREYVEEHQGNLPPGVNLTQIKSVGVRTA
jgi:hypothetical protein